MLQCDVCTCLVVLRCVTYATCAPLYQTLEAELRQLKIAAKSHSAAQSGSDNSEQISEVRARACV
jgi:hypothetical protein